MDIDITNEVIPIAKRRTEFAGVPITFYREDLFNSPGLDRLFQRGQQFHIVNCIGLTPWLELSEVESLARFFHESALVNDGSLIIDNFARHEHSSIGDDLEIFTLYHGPDDFIKALERAGFQIAKASPTANGINTVYLAHAVA